MKKKILLFLIFIHIALLSFAKTGKEYESKTGILYNYKETLYKFTNCDFSVQLKEDYKSLKIHYQSKSNSKDLSLICNSYVEHLTIICVTETLYWFACESLGFEQYFIWNNFSDNLYEPFFDMKNSVEISKIDYENQILFGDTWNSDKGIMPNQIVTLYLFSTEKQKHHKIAEKKGDVFTVKLLDDCKIEYEDQNGNLVIFDYSEWVPHNTVYSASSFLIEGVISYSPENLFSEDGLPWASANGYGIGDKITIKTSITKNIKLAFYNGFQSKEKQYLYKANSRAKRVKITCLESNYRIVVDLKDSPEKQLISLLNGMVSDNDYETVEIEILEVYPGEKYKDLCIQAIIPEF